MKNDAKYINNLEFREFVLREFEAVTTWATVEEIADFAFGGIKFAIDKFKKGK